MRDYLEKTLRQSVLIKENNSLYNDLPLVFKGKYTIFDVETNSVHWIAIQPKAEAGLVMLRKDRAKVQSVSKLNCAVFLESTTFYIKEKLVEEGIPFVLAGKQVYLPFIGYLLSDSGIRDIAPVYLTSFLTQKLILTAIYEKWDKMTVSKVAERLEVSKMSVTRCFDELEYLNVNILDIKGKSRVITIPHDIQQLWEQVKPILRNPVIMRYDLKEDIHLEKKAGISALCEYSMLADNNYPTYAVTKKELSKTGLTKMPRIRVGEEIGCTVLELGYFIDYNNKSIEDPLSVVLSLTDEEKQDERVIISITEMLEEYVW
ncbi:MAG: MarR family transcriptional regulator [Ruminococcus sp.]|nr:MarR family transcriptional regulator [Ruminococcus sp.]